MRLNRFSMYLKFLKMGTLENYGKDSTHPSPLAFAAMLSLSIGIMAPSSAEQLLLFLHPCWVLYTVPLPSLSDLGWFHSPSSCFCLSIKEGDLNCLTCGSILRPNLSWKRKIYIQKKSLGGEGCVLKPSLFKVSWWCYVLLISNK